MNGWKEEYPLTSWNNNQHINQPNHNPNKKKKAFFSCSNVRLNTALFAFLGQSNTHIALLSFKPELTLIIIILPSFLLGNLSYSCGGGDQHGIQLTCQATSDNRNNTARSFLTQTRVTVSSGQRWSQVWDVPVWNTGNLGNYESWVYLSNFYYFGQVLTESVVNWIYLDCKPDFLNKIEKKIECVQKYSFGTLREGNDWPVDNFYFVFLRK